MVSDESLIAAICGAGDRAALEELVGRHLAQVRRTVAQMVLDEAAADDVTQDVFLRAIRGLAGFDGRARFSTWLLRIAMNTAVTHLQRASRTRTTQQEIGWDDVPGAAAPPDEQLLTRERADDVQRAVGQLSPPLRAALVLTALQGVSPAEAAAIEGCSVSTMYWRIHEARKQLRKRLKEHLP